MAINEKYSYQSFKGKTFVNVDPAEFNDSEIVGSSFYQQGKPYTKVFPDGTKNLILTRCNLDNVDVQHEIIVNGGCNNQILSQNDQEYWLVDRELKPVAPRDADKFDVCGLSKDPRDIPVAPVSESVTVANDPKIIEQRAIDAAKQDDAWIREKLAADGVIASATEAR